MNRSVPAGPLTGWDGGRATVRGGAAWGLIPAMRSSAADFFSIEASFAFFVFSGHYKKFPQLSGSPVDLTLLFLASTACLLAWAVISGRIRPLIPGRGVLLMLAFSQFLLASLFWSSLDPLNVDKALRFLVLTSSAFFGGCMIAQDPVRRRRLMRLLVWLSVAILLYYGFYRYVLGIDMQSTVDVPGASVPSGADNYQEYGDHACLLFLTCLCLSVFGSRVQLAGAVTGAALATFAMISIGGRGALVFAICAIPLLAISLAIRGRGAGRGLMRLVIFVAALAAIGGAGYLAMPADDSGQFRTLDRFESQISGAQTSSMDERARGQELAFRDWLQKPIFGWGIGEFRVQDSYLQYPHNALLEILMEMGIVGAVLFFAVAGAAVVACVGIARDGAAGWFDNVMALLFLTELLSHLTVQGYLADDRIFLAYMGLAIGSRACLGIRRCALPIASSAVARRPGGIVRSRQIPGMRS